MLYLSNPLNSDPRRALRYAWMNEPHLVGRGWAFDRLGFFPDSCCYFQKTQPGSGLGFRSLLVRRKPC